MTREIPKVPPSSEVTPQNVYLNRRALIKAGVIAVSLAATGGVYRRLNRLPKGAREGAQLAGLTSTTSSVNDYPPEIVRAFKADDVPTPFESIASYNNFYEFGTDKSSPAVEAADFKTSGWQVVVDGLCAKPSTLGIDDLMKISPPEERIYRMRCVEAWSMVIPWAGYSLSRLLERVEPRSDAKYVAFTTLFDPARMPGQQSPVLQWPYVEGLRMDEAMHPLTLLATGLYGHALPPQDGAPVRLVIPWKYGFKGIKSIVKISLVADQPPTSWNRFASNEYGFYANVNPNHAHPRWSQAMERRIGDGNRPTLMFNGYAEQVGRLYAGMDLDQDY